MPLNFIWRCYWAPCKLIQELEEDPRDFLLFCRAKAFATTLGKIDDELLTRIEGRNLNIRLENGTLREVPEYSAFWFKKQCFIWDDTKTEFARLVGLDKFVACSDLHLGNDQGISREEQLLR